jgi:hypothetical protein
MVLLTHYATSALAGPSKENLLEQVKRFQWRWNHLSFWMKVLFLERTVALPVRPARPFLGVAWHGVPAG